MAEIHSKWEACRVLGVPMDATEEQIKHAYKELSKQYHPDVQPDERLHWQYYDIVEAYRFLTEEHDGGQNHQQQPFYGAVARGPRVMGSAASERTDWVAQRRNSDEAYAKWEKQRKKRKKEKEAELEEKQKEIRKQREYEDVMKQINAIRTARIIEAILERVRDEK